MDVRLGRPDSQPEPESNAPVNPDATSGSTRSETHAEPEADVSTSIGTDMEIDARDRSSSSRREHRCPERQSGFIHRSEVDGGTAGEGAETRRDQ